MVNPLIEEERALQALASMTKAQFREVVLEARAGHLSAALKSNNAHRVVCWTTGGGAEREAVRVLTPGRPLYDVRDPSDNHRSIGLFTLPALRDSVKEGRGAIIVL